jgi:hypothetical protein
MQLCKDKLCESAVGLRGQVTVPVWVVHQVWSVPAVLGCRLVDIIAGCSCALCVLFGYGGLVRAS